MASKQDTQAMIDSWAKAQKAADTARAALETAQEEANKYSKRIYEALGTKPFSVKALGGKGYRAFYKKARTSSTGKPLAEQWHVIPLPDFSTQADF